MLSVFIVEDEVQNLERLQNMINLHCPDLSIIGNASGVEEAYNKISELKPELVFLDIELTDGMGFDILDKFDSIPFKLIFVTAFEEYAVKAFRISALDYLLKPVDPDELIEAVEKARQQIGTELLKQVNNASKNINSHDIEKIVLKDLNNIYLVKIADIIYFEADGNYTRFHLTNGKSLIISRPIKEFESLLKGNRFMRIHRSYEFNLDHFLRYEKTDGGTVVLSNESKIPISSNKKDELFDFINRYIS